MSIIADRPSGSSGNEANIFFPSHKKRREKRCEASGFDKAGECKGDANSLASMLPRRYTINSASLAGAELAGPPAGKRRRRRAPDQTKPLLERLGRSENRSLTSLEYRTQVVRVLHHHGLDHVRPEQIVTIRDYGEGYVEGSWGWSTPGQRKQTMKGKSKNRELNIERSNRRAKARLRRICMSAGLDHLVTLTYRKNMVNKVEAWADFERFIRIVHRYFPDWQYVVTTEQQERGAYHFHLGVKGYQDVELLRHIWRSVVGDGNIDVQYIKTKKGHKWKRNALATYLAKYIDKDMETELNEKRFRTSKGITIPKITMLIPPYIKAKDYVLHKIESLAGKVGFVWESEESLGRYGWACSWG